MIEQLERIAENMERMIASTENFSQKFCENEDKKLARINDQLKRNKEIIDELTNRP